MKLFDIIYYQRGPVQMFYLEIESKSYHQGGVFSFYYDGI